MTAWVPPLGTTSRIQFRPKRYPKSSNAIPLAERQGKRLPSVPLDIDSAPVDVHGHQPNAEWNGHDNARICHPLFTSIAETGDLFYPG